MHFRRKSDGQGATAKQWFCHASHPAVQPAKAADAPSLSSPEKLGVLNGVLVFPGDWIVTLDAGTLLVQTEQMFRRAYEAVAREYTNSEPVPANT
jgi:hypothetical protein